MTTAIFKNGGNKCHRSQVIVYLKLESPETYFGIPQLLLCMPYLLRYGDIEFGSRFEKWPSPRYARFLKCSPSRILKPYVYITQINSQTSIPPKCLRAYRAGPGLIDMSQSSNLSTKRLNYPYRLPYHIHTRPCCKQRILRCARGSKVTEIESVILDLKLKVPKKHLQAVLDLTEWAEHNL